MSSPYCEGYYHNECEKLLSVGNMGRPRCLGRCYRAHLILTWALAYSHVPLSFHPLECTCCQSGVREDSELLAFRKGISTNLFLVDAQHSFKPYKKESPIPKRTVDFTSCRSDFFFSTPSYPRLVLTPGKKKTKTDIAVCNEFSVRKYTKYLLMRSTDERQRTHSEDQVSMKMSPSSYLVP